MIWSVIVYIENRLQEKIDYSHLENSVGFSITHIRDIFSKKTGITLSKYILLRKISNCAFEILHSHQSITAVGIKYGFSNPDTFTRAFKRITGLTPKEFKKLRPPVGRIKLCSGVYGVGLLQNIKKNNEGDNKS